MKEGAKRQETQTSLPASTTISGSNTFNEEGGNGGTGQPPATSPTQGRDGSEGTRASTTSPGTPEATALTEPAVEFLFNESPEFERGLALPAHLLNMNGGSYAVPLKLHQGLDQDSGFQIDKHVCGIVSRDAKPKCEKALEFQEMTPTSQNSREAKVEDDLLTFEELPEGGAYFLRVTWTKAESKVGDGGFSYSPLFGVVTTGDKASDAGAFLATWGGAPVSFEEVDSNERYAVTLTPGKGDDRASQDLIDELNRAISPIDVETPGVTGTTRPTASPSARNAAGGEIEGSDDTASPAPGGGGGGLQKPAIIGIAVAASIVGLAAIGLLVWFFCLRNRRRRGSKDHGPYAAPDHQASEYMVNKETTGAHVTESPHSPYSDDGSLAHAQGQGPSSLAQAQQTNQYSDAPPIAAPVPRSASQQAGDRAESGAGTRSGTPGGHNVSHLIEEGMTEADIRRLEEEERALDDAIERAGHGRR